MTESGFMDGGMDHEGGGHEHGHGHDHSHDHGHDHASEGGASTTPIYNAGLKGIKFSDLFKGINFTPNFSIAMFFLGYALWLFVLYFIRHNEPFANQVLGTPNAGAPTVHQDRHIVNGVSNALPIKSEFFTPDKAGTVFGFKSDAQHAPTAPSSPLAQNLGHTSMISGGRERVVVPHPEPLPGELMQHSMGSQPSRFGAPASAPVSMPSIANAPLAPRSMRTFGNHQTASFSPYGAAASQFPTNHQRNQASAAAPAQYAQMPQTYSPYAGQAGNGMNAIFDDNGSTYQMPVQSGDGLRRRVVTSR